MAQPDPISAVADALLEKISVRLGEVGQPVARVGLVWGEVAWDEACEGYLWARFVRGFLTREFPDEVAGFEHCVVLQPAAEFEVGVIRCVSAAQVSGQGKVTLPSKEALEAEARVLAVDAGALWLGTVRQSREWGKMRRSIVGQVDPVGPSGIFSRSQLVVTVEMPDCFVATP